MDEYQLAALVLAPVIGSFAGCLVERLPRDEAIVFEQSHCRSCGQTLGVLDLMPILSWLVLRGRCRHCGQAIGNEPILVELAALGIACWAVAMTSGWIALASVSLGWFLLPLAVIDWRHLRLPDALTLPLAVVGGGVSWLIGEDQALAALIGVVLGWSIFSILAFAHRRMRGHDGLGSGDAKLLAAGGAWLGWASLPSVLLLTGIFGLAWYVAAARRGKSADAGMLIPLGPALCAAIWLVWLYGPLTLGNS